MHAQYVSVVLFLAILSLCLALNRFFKKYTSFDVNHM